MYRKVSMNKETIKERSIKEMKMEGCRYQKIICSYGHSSGVFHRHASLPKKCPQCGQPYNRLEHRPVPCFEDGSVPHPSRQETRKAEMTEELPEQQDAVSVCTGPPSMIKPVNDPSSQHKGAGHVPGGDEPCGKIPSYTVSKRHGPSVRETIQGAGKMSKVQAKHPASCPDPVVRLETDKGQGHGPLRLITGGTYIDIPKEGAFLGRGGLGQECFCLNPLVSRKHAFVQNDRPGNLRVQDAGSLNGTFIDDGGGRRKLLPDETAALKPGDKIWVADQILAVEIYEDG